MTGAAPRPGLVAEGLRFLGRRRGAVGALAAFSVLAAVQTFLLGYGLARALDDGFLAGRAWTGLGWLGVAALGVFAGSVGMGGVYRAVARLVEPLRDALVREVAGDGLRRAVEGGVTRSTPVGTAVVSRLTHQVEIARDSFAGLVLVTQTFLVSLVGTLAGLLWLAPGLLLFVLPALVLGLVVFAFALRPLARRQRAVLRADEQLAHALGDCAAGLRDVVACGAEARVAGELRALIDAEARAATALARWAVTRVLALALGGHLPIVLLLFLAPWLLDRGLTAGELVGALTYLTQSLLPALRSLVDGFGGAAARLAVVITWLRGSRPAPSGSTDGSRTGDTPDGAAEEPAPRPARPARGWHGPVRLSSDPPTQAASPAGKGHGSLPDASAATASGGPPHAASAPAPDGERAASPQGAGPGSGGEWVGADPPRGGERGALPRRAGTGEADGVPPHAARPARPALPRRTGPPADPFGPDADALAGGPGGPVPAAEGALPGVADAGVQGSYRPVGGSGGSGAGAGKGVAAPGADVVFRGVSFAYGGRADPVVRELSLEVPAGGHWVVVGPSGVGKSTVAGLAAGLLRPTAGEVLLRGRPVAGRNAAELARHRTLIPQEAYVFSGTVADNLGYLCPGPMPAAYAMLSAAEAVGAGELVDRLGGPGGRVEPAELSAGERQLVALARALLAPAPVVLLDEATCHLDPAAESRAELAFARRPDTTLLVIAHRVSSALRADHVLVLDGTETVGGTHREVLARSPLYRDLVGGWSHPAGAPGDADGVQAVAGAGLADAGGEVVAHRALGQQQPAGDLGDGRALGRE